MRREKNGGVKKNGQPSKQRKVWHLKPDHPAEEEREGYRSAFAL